jgi:hypothetical protein
MSSPLESLVADDRRGSRERVGITANLQLKLKR